MEVLLIIAAPVVVILIVKALIAELISSLLGIVNLEELKISQIFKIFSTKKSSAPP